MVQILKAVVKTAKQGLVNLNGNQNLFRPITASIIKSSNNYSTCNVNKETFSIQPRTNNKMMNIFAVSNNIRNYSTTFNFESNDKTSSEEPLNPIEYASWTKEQVCSLLSTDKKKGGAGLDFEDVKPLYDAGFKGASIANIITDLKNEKLDIWDVTNETHRSFPNATRDTLVTVVNWVENLLETRLFHVWSPDYLCKQVQEDEHLSKLFKQLGFNGTVLKQLVSDLKAVGIDKTIQALQVRYNIPIEDCKSIVMWSTKFAPKVRATIVVERYQDLSIDQKQRFINVIDSLNVDFMTDYDFYLVEEHLIPIIQKLEQVLNVYSNDKSKEVFNSFMEPYGLQKQDSLIHLYLSDDEKSASSSVVCCDFAPTFPQYKYNEREEFLNVTYHSQHSVSTFLEASGIGKTHFAYHLTSNSKYLVVPIDREICNSLIQNLEKTTIDPNSENYRTMLNRKVETFHRFMLGLTSIIYRYCKTYLPTLDRDSTLYRDLMRFLNNKIKKDISNLYNNEMMVSIINQSPTIHGEKLLWLLDEAHILATKFDKLVPRTDTTQMGNLLTLLVRQFRVSGPIVLTTTYASFVEDKIEKVITHSSSKQVLEKFSYDFKEPLPLLHANQVESFLNNFISLNKNEEIWKMVSYFIQGPFRRSSAFLQALLKNTYYNDYSSTNGLIYDSLVSIFDSSIEEELTYFNPDYREVFFNLAFFGECSFSDQPKSIYKFLLQCGISFTMDYTSNRFKLISPIERIRMMEFLKKEYGKEWISESDKVLKNNPNLEKSRIVEIEVADKIINSFKSIITKYFRDTDYISKYELKSKYILEDSETSKANEKDGKISTFILNTIRDNMNELNIENSYPLNGKNFNYKTVMDLDLDFDFNIQISFPDGFEYFYQDLLPRLLVKPCENAGPDIIGILMLKSEFSELPLPKCIPLIVAISELETDQKHQQDYHTTNLENMYCEHVGTNTCRISTKENEKNERAKIENAIQSITKSGKMLRIMLHPTLKPTDSVSTMIDRINMLSGGTDSVADTPSANAVILKNGNCVLELFQNDLDHCNE